MANKLSKQVVLKSKYKHKPNQVIRIVSSLMMYSWWNDKKNFLVLYSYRTDNNWSTGKIGLTLEDINLWAMICAIHWYLNRSRQQITMQGGRYIVSPFTFICSVMCQSYELIILRGKKNRKLNEQSERNQGFHNPLIAFAKKKGDLWQWKNIKIML